MNDDQKRLDALLRRALPEPEPAATARIHARLAAEIARRPLPTYSTVGWLRRMLPAGYGALGMAAICALWIAIAPTPPNSEVTSSDLLSAVSALPFNEDAL